ncbi:TerB family tellurite resistance protein [Maribellus maritimus]|uniref:TerB family tellurite resistance protein n=1 Tax=Maribellus maritimus TaxID=2870838 RepID=UPI001EEBA922|nr:hypothetical protein [Maribellus maritimus]MCG6191372.1 hypothetical protein [Maribellus maritimus]
MNYTSEERMAILKILLILSAIDNDVDKRETMTISTISVHLNASSAEIVMAMEMENIEAGRIIGRMSAEKKIELIALARIVAKADGIIDEMEAEFIVKLIDVLGI